MFNHISIQTVFVTGDVHAIVLYTHDVPLTVNHLFLLHISDVDVFFIFSHHCQMQNCPPLSIFLVIYDLSRWCFLHGFVWNSWVLSKMKGKNPENPQKSSNMSRCPTLDYPKLKKKWVAFTSSCRMAVSCVQGVARCACSLVHGEHHRVNHGK